MKLTAPTGYKYTSKKEVELKYKSFASEVYLAVNDSEDNWELVPDAEVERIRKEQRDAFIKEQKEMQENLEKMSIK